MVTKCCASKKEIREIKIECCKDCGKQMPEMIEDEFILVPKHWLELVIYCSNYFHEREEMYLGSRTQYKSWAEKTLDKSKEFLEKTNK